MTALRDRYTVFASYDLVDLSDNVTEAIHRGDWVPAGGICVTCSSQDPESRTLYMQALWRPERVV